jgi:hypothetical protein
MTTTLSPGDDWVPDACTLPTVERPLRRAEFDDLFVHDVLAVRRESTRRLRLALRPDPEAAARAARLAVQETGCCSFFGFGLVVSDGALSLVVETAPAHEDVLAALGGRAEALARAVS